MEDKHSYCEITMPNPYVGNDDAAEYLEYYASSSMERDAVHRLHNDGCQRQREARQRIEAQIYPSRPPVVRTQDQLNAFLHRNKEAADRKQRKLLALDRELYGAKAAAAIHLDPARLEHHVKHMYDEQMRKMKRRLAAQAEIRGDRPPSPRELEVKELYSAREAKWRPVAHSPKRQDGKDTLLYDSPRRRSISAGGGSGRGSSAAPLSKEEREAKERYFKKMAKPIRVHEKVPVPPRDGFNVYGK
jgi:hypothetical protein